MWFLLLSVLRLRSLLLCLYFYTFRSYLGHHNVINLHSHICVPEVIYVHLYLYIYICVHLCIYIVTWYVLCIRSIYISITYTIYTRIRVLMHTYSMYILLRYDFPDVRKPLYRLKFRPRFFQFLLKPYTIRPFIRVSYYPCGFFLSSVVFLMTGLDFLT